MIATLDEPSALLLNACHDAMRALGIAELLDEQIHAIATQGLTLIDQRNSPLGAVSVYTLSPYAELLLREYLWIAAHAHWKPHQKLALMMQRSELAGYA